MATIGLAVTNKNTNQGKEMPPTKILVVDDEENIVNIVSAYLKKKRIRSLWPMMVKRPSNWLLNISPLVSVEIC